MSASCSATECVTTPAAPNLFLWLRADVGVTLTGGKVSAWADQSGNNYNAVQPTEASRPTVTANAQNSLPAITFDGSTQRLRFPTTTAVTSFTTFAVYKLTAALNYGGGTFYPFAFGDTANVTGGYTGIEIGSASAGNADTFDVFGGFSNDARATLTGLSASGAASSYRVISWTSASTNQTKVFSDGNPAAMSNTGADIAWNFTLGSGSESDFGAIGNCPGGAGPSFVAVNHAELIVYRTVLADAARQQIEGYLAWKWGLQAKLPAGHPHKNAAP